MERRAGGLLRSEKNFFVMLIIVEIQFVMISILLCYIRNWLRVTKNLRKNDGMYVATLQ
jgi:hypothetical protein